MPEPTASGGRTDPTAPTPARHELRIAVVSDAELERNGVGAYYADLAAHLGEHVAELAIISPGGDNAYGSLSMPMPGDSTQTLWMPNVMAVRRRLRALKPHAVILPTPGPWGLLGARLGSGVGAALIVGFHTHFEQLTHLYWNPRLGLIPRTYMRWVSRYLFKRGRMVLANSHAMAEVARGLGAPQVDLMGTPIPRAFVDTPPPPLPEHIEKVLFAGRLAPEKNVEAVVEAAAAHPHIAFTIAGDGPLRASLEARAAELPNLSLVGWVPRAELPALIDRHHLLILPSHVESLGTIALEALARGRNVLVSTHCGITEWPMLDRALFRIGDGETVAQALGRALDVDATLRHRKATLGAEGAREMNAWAIEGWLKVLEDHVGPPAAG
ncbi:glycosyltransferase [Roseospirillum parvum]|uniref:Glycosyltransferase involved in cell wall bisynthesis n=1 Tax=Roseospirillum parvum TaxID=83401 RepID=A0A1G7WM68_9PROT|nr:glycosyltransferase [Roseospirillum parvum]SDG73004.1 Glycosyltransferase involved in cell wall bisynthesis [Roseospirillum parvum]